jgi:hypothetical protein
MPADPSDSSIRVELKGVTEREVTKEIARGRILEAALAELRKSPTFDPQALSVVFGLKW